MLYDSPLSRALFTLPPTDHDLDRAFWKWTLSPTFRTDRSFPPATSRDVSDVANLAAAKLSGTAYDSKFVAVELSVQLPQQSLHRFHGGFGEPIAAGMVWAGKFVNDAILLAKFGKWSPKLRAAIRFQFARKTNIAKPSQQSFANCLGRRRSQTCYPRISAEAINHDKECSRIQVEQVRGDLVHGKGGGFCHHSFHGKGRKL